MILALKRVFWPRVLQVLQINSLLYITTSFDRSHF